MIININIDIDICIQNLISIWVTYPNHTNKFEKVRCIAENDEAKVGCAEMATEK